MSDTRSIPGNNDCEITLAIAGAASAIRSQLAQQLLDCSLTLRELSLLSEMKRKPGICQAELATVLNVGRASINPVIKKLCSRKLASIEAIDERRRRLVLTERGTKSLAYAEQVLARNDAKIRSILDPTTTDAILAALSRITDVYGT